MNTPTPAEERRRGIEELRRQVQQRRTLGDRGDRNWIDPQRIPQGMNYNWKRYSIFGQLDDAYLSYMKEMGWSAVPAKRHPEVFGPTDDASKPGIKGGDILMERPIEISRDAYIFELKNAQASVRDQTQKLKLNKHELMPTLAPKVDRRHGGIEIAADDI